MKGLYISHRKNGSVTYQLAFRDPLTDKARRLSMDMPYHSVRNQKRAEEELTRRLDALISGRSGKTLLSSAIDAYVADMSLSWRVSTTERNRATLGRILRVFPEGTILVNVTPQRWRETLTKLSGTSAGTYNEYLKRVKAFLHWCAANDYLETDICPKLARKAEERSGSDEKATDKYLEPAEAAAVLEATRSVETWHLLTKFMLLSGLRCGEALALTDLDVTSEYIRVNKTLDPATRKIGPPKTPKSNREVSITKELAGCIAEIRRRRAWLMSAYRFSSPLFFFDSSGDYIKYYTFDRYLGRASEKAIGKKISTHWLRHTHASFLLAAGIPIAVISRRLGHETTAITERVYLHVIESLKQKDADMLSGVQLLSSPSIVSLAGASAPLAGTGSF